MVGKTLYKAKYVYPVSKPVIEDGYLLVEDGKIVSAGNEDDLFGVDTSGADEVVFEDGMILPGLINAHTHLEYSGLGKINAKSFIDFLWQSVEQAAGMNEKKLKEGIKTGIKQSLDSGVTTLADISRWGVSPLVLSEYPVLADVGIEAFSYDSKSSEKVFDLLKSKIDLLQEKISDNVRLSMSPHSPYNSDARLWELIINHSNETGMLVHAHVAESLEEKNWFDFGTSEIDEFHSLIGWPKITPQITSMSPVEYLSTMHFVNENMLAAHLCFASSRDLEVLEERKVDIVICPRSNLNLHKKMLDFNLLRSLKINAILATDGVTSAGNLNLLEDVNIYNTKNVISCEELTKMVTITPAKALKVYDKVGSLDAGKLANFIVFDSVEEPQKWFQTSKPDSVYIKGELVTGKVSAL